MFSVTGKRHINTQEIIHIDQIGCWRMTSKEVSRTITGLQWEEEGF